MPKFLDQIAPGVLQFPIGREGGPGIDIHGRRVTAVLENRFFLEKREFDPLGWAVSVSVTLGEVGPDG